MLLNRSTKPVIEPDQAWEAGALLSAVCAHVDEAHGELLLYYLIRYRDRPVDNVLCIARSRDGRAWSKPDCGDGTNIVMRSSGHSCNWGIFMPTAIFKDELEENPDLRWKVVYWDRPDPSMPAGICLAASGDGTSWTSLHQRPIITNANDAMSMIDSYAEGQSPLGSGNYFIYQQTWKHNPSLPTDRDNLKGIHRRISIWTAGEFEGTWVGPVVVLEPDAEDDPFIQFYWLTPFRTRSGAYGGLLNCHHTSDQTMDVQLVRSQDGWTWSRENQRKPILELGEPGRFDCGMVVAAARPIDWNGKTLLFYNGRSTVHDGQLRYPKSEAPMSSPGIGLAEFDHALLD